MCLLVATQALAAETKFSHQLHLNKVGATCTICHSAASASKQAADRNLPTAETCLACHNGETTPSVDTAWLAERELKERTFRFNHEFHLKLGNVAAIIRAALDSGSYLGKADHMGRLLNSDNSCQSCHRGLEETDLASQANLPVMSDCLVCHTEIDNPFSCEECHLSGINLKPAGHTREFIDLHSTGKVNLDKATCLPCHGTNFACMGCH